jgi:hypothetical protein
MLIATASLYENKTKLVLRTVLLCLIMFLLAPAHADEVYSICIGDRDNVCGVRPWFSCGTSAEQAARAVCTTSTTSAQEISQFTIIKLSEKPGGRCGYAVFQVTCKK